MLNSKNDAGRFVSNNKSISISPSFLYQYRHRQGVRSDIHTFPTMRTITQLLITPRYFMQLLKKVTRLQNVTIVTCAKAIHKIHCGECNWGQFIVAETDAPLKFCPWCGWNGLNICAISELGGYQNIRCEKHVM
ncbi:hypothetical protein ACO0LM_02245 [Undibacterium sp. Di26W]|uniref:hypothetical protein n=1 Tax=Undibacterium sp. Di26W TaxID=3413035 RepID=UPI003BF09DE2